MINALNSGARVFMADLEDALSPDLGERRRRPGGALRTPCAARSPSSRRRASRTALASGPAPLVVRPRGWHLDESHLTRRRRARCRASLFDFGPVPVPQRRRAARRRVAGRTYYLPKIESHLEARLWNDVFLFAQERLGVPRGCVRATVLIETITAAFEMDEILYELREHAAGLNAGRWDYLFSVIKRFRDARRSSSPDRTAADDGGAVHARLHATCWSAPATDAGRTRSAAWRPSSPTAAIPRSPRRALAKVREDKEREAGDGFDGTWVAHPDLVPVATEIFDEVLARRDNQKRRPA